LTDSGAASYLGVNRTYMKNTSWLLIFVSSMSFGQMVGSDSQLNMTSMTNGEMFRTFDHRFKGIEGFPTIFETHLPGVIYIKNGQTLFYQKVNYDIIANEVVVTKDGKEMAVKNYLVTKFSLILDEDSINYKKVVLPTGTRFVEELVRGDVKLYKAIVKKVEGPTNSGAYSLGSRNSRVIEEIDYYWQHGDKPINVIMNKTKLLNELQEATGQDYKQFMKENKLTIKQDNHLKKLFNHVNRKTKT
jgi:hypothetical protein